MTEQFTPFTNAGKQALEKLEQLEHDKIERFFEVNTYSDYVNNVLNRSTMDDDNYDQ